MPDIIPDSDPITLDDIEVFDTPERDNPAFGSVSIRLVTGMHGTVQRMPRADAEILRDKLTEYLEAPRG